MTTKNGFAGNRDQTHQYVNICITSILINTWEFVCSFLKTDIVILQQIYLHHRYYMYECTKVVPIAAVLSKAPCHGSWNGPPFS